MKKNKAQRGIAAVVSFAAVSACAMVASAADIHVYPGQSFSSAVNRARPGDRVLVHAGTYAGGGWIGPVNGTASAPITVLSADGPRRAVIEGGSESLRVGDASSYLVFDGFEVRNSGNNVIHIDGGAHHITLRNLYAHDAGTNGDVVKLNQAHHLTIERSEFARPGQRTSDAADNPYQECLDFVDVDDSVIRDNWMHDGGSMIAFVKGGSRNTIVERNVFSQQRAGASDPVFGLGGPTDVQLLGGEQYEVINIVFRNNVVMGGVTGGVAVYDADGAYIANNLFLNNDRVLVEFRAGNGPAGGSRNVQVVNNLMVDTRGRMPEPYRRSSHTLSAFSTSNNLFWNNGAAIPGSSLVSLTAQPGHLVANPLITAPAATASRDAVISGAKPSASSPAAGTAIDASGSPFGVVDDITAAPRATRRDRGPWVLASTTTAPTTPTSPTAPTTPTSPTSPTTGTGTRVTTVSYTATPTPGIVNRAVTVRATSTGSANPRYRFWVITPAGAWTRPCGDYSANTSCTFTPTATGAWQLAVSARDASSTAQYEATTNAQPFRVTTATTTTTSPPSGTTSTTSCPPEPTRLDASGQPRNAAGQIRQCWPGEPKCFCDSDNDCYAQDGYVACTARTTYSDAVDGAPSSELDGTNPVAADAADVTPHDEDAGASSTNGNGTNAAAGADESQQPGVGCSVRGGPRSGGLLAALSLLGIAVVVTRLRRQLQR